MAALFVCTEQTLIDILLAFTDRNDMIKKDKKAVADGNGGMEILWKQLI